jgi:hypothetical protein
MSLTPNEQEKATDDYIIGCLKCASKHYGAIGIVDKFLLTNAAYENLDSIRMQRSKYDGSFRRKNEKFEEEK